MKNKFLSVIISILLIMSFTAGVVACGEEPVAPPAPEHEHVAVEHKKAPTCTENGYEYYTCSDDACKDKIYKDAKCTVEVTLGQATVYVRHTVDKQTGKCSVCGADIVMGGDNGETAGILNVGSNYVLGFDNDDPDYVSYKRSISSAYTFTGEGTYKISLSNIEKPSLKYIDRMHAVYGMTVEDVCIDRVLVNGNTMILSGNGYSYFRYDNNSSALYVTLNGSGTVDFTVENLTYKDVKNNWIGLSAMINISKLTDTDGVFSKTEYNANVLLDYEKLGAGYKLLVNGADAGVTDSDGKATVSAYVGDRLTAADASGRELFGATIFEGEKNVTLKCFEPAADLRWKENFKILVLADVQFCFYNKVVENFNNYIDKVVEREKPDLIVLTGDQTEHFYDGKIMFDTFIKRMEALGVPWCAVYGNHDGQLPTEDVKYPSYYTRAEMTEMYLKADNCLFTVGPKMHGACNYFVNLVDEDGKVKSCCFLIDGGDYDMASGGYDYIHQDQMDWYKDIVNALKAGNNGVVVPSITFFHIPLQEFVNARDQFFADGVGYGNFDENGFGYVACSNVQSGFFDLIKELGSTTSIVCGHDHQNTCCIDYKDVQMIYALKSSNDAYNNGYLGTTLLTLTSDDKPHFENILYSELYN